MTATTRTYSGHAGTEEHNRLARIHVPSPTPRLRLLGWTGLALAFAGPSFLLFALAGVSFLSVWESRGVSGALGRHEGHASSQPRTSRIAWTAHFSKMVVAMYVGMLVYHAAIRPLVVAVVGEAPFEGDLGYSWMLLSMVVPMVVLMRFEGHSSRMSNEMAVAMVAPVLVCFSLVRLGICALVPFLSWLTTVSVYPVAHDAMLAGMVGLMLLRREMYVAKDAGEQAETDCHTSTVRV